MSKSILTLLFLLSGLTSFGQYNNEINKLKNEPKDTLFINEIIKITSKYARLFPTEMDSVIDSVLPICQTLKYTKGSQNFLIQKVIIYTDQAKYHAADSVLRKISSYGRLSKEMALKIKNCKANIHINKGDLQKGKSLLLQDINIKDENQLELIINLARIYQQLGRHDSSLFYYNRCLELVTPKSKDNLPTIYNNLGVVHGEMNNTEHAIEAYRKASDLAFKSGDLINWTNSYGNIGVIKMKNAEWDTALTMLKTILQKTTNATLPIDIKTWILNCIGVCQLNLKYYLAAEKTFNEVALLASKTKNPLSEARAIFNMGNTMLRANKQDEGFVIMKKSIQIANNAQLFLEAANLTKKLSQFYNSFNYPDSAYQYLETHYVLLDSLKANETHLKYLEIQEKYKHSVLEAKLIKVSSENIATRKNNLLMIAALVFLTIVIGLLFIIKRKNNYALRLSRDRIQLMKNNEVYQQQIIEEKEQRILTFKKHLAIAVGIEKPELRALDFKEILEITELKPRHVKILIALCSGITNHKEIAHQVNMEVGTVQKYIQQIREVLDAPSTVNILPKLYEILDKRDKNVS
jgi:tetratricopeptide (TPR) repeat protein